MIEIVKTTVETRQDCTTSIHVSMAVSLNFQDRFATWIRHLYGRYAVVSALAVIQVTFNQMSLSDI